MARCQGLRRSLGSQSQGKARRGWCKANCARHRCPWGPASQRAKAEVRRATCPGPASSLHPTRPAPNPRRVAFQSHNLFGRAVFNRDRSLLRFPLQPHGAPSRLLERDGEGRAAPTRTASSQPSCAPRSQGRPAPAWSSRSPQKGWSGRAQPLTQSCVASTGWAGRASCGWALSQVGRSPPASSGASWQRARLSPARPRLPLCAMPPLVGSSGREKRCS